jgi:hypothetical protein
MIRRLIAKLDDHRFAIYGAVAAHAVKEIFGLLERLDRPPYDLDEFESFKTLAHACANVESAALHFVLATAHVEPGAAFSEELGALREALAELRGVDIDDLLGRRVAAQVVDEAAHVVAEGATG